MKKLFLIGTMGIFWSCTAHKKITIPQNPCQDSLNTIQNFTSIGGWYSPADQSGYDVYIGSTPSQNAYLKVDKNKTFEECYSLGKGPITYEPFYLESDRHTNGELVLYYSFTNDVKKISYDDLRRMSKGVMEKFDIHSLNVKFR